MTLGELIQELEKVEPNLIAEEGFGNGHSYRGYYNDCAFEPMPNQTFGEMLAAAKRVLNTTQQGWKGGDYVMTEHVEVYLAEEGSTGDGMSPLLIRLMASVAQANKERVG